MRCRVLSAPLVLAGCTSFATVRSAEVRPGPALTIQSSFAPSPGDEAGWFWSLDCATRCNHAIGAADLAVAFGGQPGWGPPFTVGLGVNGVLFPYAEGYVQLGRDPRMPFGVGGRLGMNAGGWNEHQLYGRLDVPLGSETRLLFNPGLFYHTGNSPNGQNPGSFLGLVGGLGLGIGEGPVAATPGLSVVLGRSGHRSGLTQFGPATQPFVMFSLALTFRRSHASGR